MADPKHDSVDALYEQVRTVMPASSDSVMAGQLLSVSPGIRVLALRTPTLPPAAHTNAYLVGPSQGPQALVDPGSPYADQQSVLDAVLQAESDLGRPLGMVLLTHHHGDHTGGAMATAARWGVPIAAHAATARWLEGSVDVTRILAPGETIALGDVVATCVFTPGHDANRMGSSLTGVVARSRSSSVFFAARR